MENEYREKVRADRVKKLKMMDDMIEINLGQIKRMDNDMEVVSSVESFYSIHNRENELMDEIREMKKVRNDLNDIIIQSRMISVR